MWLIDVVVSFLLTLLLLLSTNVHVTLGQRPTCPSVNQYQMALPPTPALPSCVGAPSASWQKLLVGSGAEWVFCYKDNAYIAVKESVNYGTIQTVRTSFCALRFDPVRLFVDQGGLDFSSTTISPGATFNNNMGKYNYAPWLFAAECTASTEAVALGDLSDTPFSFFNVSAFHQGGLVRFQEVNSTGSNSVQIRVSGGCGWVLPAAMPNYGWQNDSNTDAACTNFGYAIALVRRGGGTGPSTACVSASSASTCFTGKRSVQGCEPTPSPTPKFTPTPSPTPSPTPLPTPEPQHITLPPVDLSTTTSTVSAMSTFGADNGTSTTASETNVIVVIGEPSSSKSVVSEWWFWVAIVGGGLVCCAAVALVVLVMRRRKKRDASPASAESAEVAASASGPASHIYGSFVGVQTVNGDSGAVPERDPIEYSAFTITDEEQNQQIKSAPPGASSILYEQLGSDIGAT
jgi:hypothetical protein